MNEKSTAGTKAGREAEKARRLAEALRANLAKRKTRQRARAAGKADAESGSGASDAGAPWAGGED